MKLWATSFAVVGCRYFKFRHDSDQDSYVEIEDKLFLVDRTKLQNDLQTSDRVCLSEVCLVNSEEAAARAEVSVIYK